MKIALDVDGVLADIILVWVDDYNRTHKKSVNKNDIVHWDFWKDLGLNKYSFYQELSKCWSRWKEVPAMEQGIANAVETLRSVGKVDIVTAREEATSEYVTQWLEHNDIKYDDYVTVPDGRDKADLGYDIFIDDSPHNVIRIAAKGKNALLYDQPWNKSISDSKIIRIKKLAEAVNVILYLQYKLQNFLDSDSG
ncbi:MAG: hypothetical protein ACE5J2_02050 [Nitrososphaerales archaeon]